MQIYYHKVWLVLALVYLCVKRLKQKAPHNAGLFILDIILMLSEQLPF